MYGGVTQEPIELSVRLEGFRTVGVQAPQQRKFEDEYLQNYLLGLKNVQVQRCRKLGALQTCSEQVSCRSNTW